MDTTSVNNRRVGNILASSYYHSIASLCYDQAVVHILNTECLLMKHVFMKQCNSE